jgi:putative transposase
VAQIAASIAEFGFVNPILVDGEGVLIAGQARPLEPLYPLVFVDALRVKVRDEGTVWNKAVYVALGVRPDGTKEVLGLWIEQTEGAKFWLRVMTKLRQRGVEDILLAVVDGLKGFPDAIAAVFPRT